MAGTETGSDRGVGFGVALGLVALGGAAVMALNPASPAAGWGFALAVVAGALAVMAAQLG